MKLKRLPNIFFAFLFLAVFLLLSSCEDNQSEENTQTEVLGEANMAYRWSEITLAATARDTERNRPRPTITARYLALIFTSIFDAWTFYDENSSPVYFPTDTQKRPVVERTVKNKEIAISYAAYSSLMEYFPADSVLYNDYMRSIGLNPKNKTMDVTTPEGIGNSAAHHVITARKKDGSNQYGDEEGGNGEPYFDYTYYEPVNTVDNNYNIAHWQPKYFTKPTGEKWAPSCLTPFWCNVKPIALDSASQFRPGPPPAIGSEQLKRELQEVIDLQANLTDEQKALVEFMRDGPASVQQAGHWLKFSQDVSRRDKHTLDDDVKMFFALEIAAMDAFIACWDTKMFYDSPRPYALIHHYFEHDTIRVWGGEGKSWVDTLATCWRPYSPDSFLCPPFPAYVSGHSTVSGVCSEMLRLFTGSDFFGQEVTMVAGSMTEPGYVGSTVTIKMPTFTETANIAGQSRVLGGYHIQSDNLMGLKLGRDVAKEVWMFYLAHVGK